MSRAEMDMGGSAPEAEEARVRAAAAAIKAESLERRRRMGSVRVRDATSRAGRPHHHGARRWNGEARS
jgi:hypothetical protein